MILQESSILENFLSFNNSIYIHNHKEPLGSEIMMAHRNFIDTRYDWLQEAHAHSFVRTMQKEYQSGHTSSASRTKATT